MSPSRPIPQGAIALAPVRVPARILCAPLVATFVVLALVAPASTASGAYSAPVTGTPLAVPPSETPSGGPTAIAAPSLVAPAAVPGYNGWYWPTGHDISSAGSSWLQYRTWYSDAPAWHVAFDDCDPYRTPVYALTWGEVLEASMDVGGYGPGATRGGAVVVLYKNEAGAEFKALYGHVQSLAVSKGAKVVPGQKLAELNNYDPPHVHFGINLGRTYPSSSTSKYYVGIWMGHTHDYKTVDGDKVPVTYNWTNPVAYLRNHRPFSPPPAIVTTPTVPSLVRARRTVTAYGILTPKHPRGTRPVTLELERLDDGQWTLVDTRPAIVWDRGTRSRFDGQLRPMTRGRWRVRARVQTDSAHLAGYSGFREFSVR